MWNSGLRAIDLRHRSLAFRHLAGARVGVVGGDHAARDIAVAAGAGGTGGRRIVPIRHDEQTFSRSPTCAPRIKTLVFLTKTCTRRPMRRFLQLLLLLLPTTVLASPPPSPSRCATRPSWAPNERHACRLACSVPSPTWKAVVRMPRRMSVPGPGPSTSRAAASSSPASGMRSTPCATLQAQGMRSIDVGCMQVNLMHHPNAFASLDAAFDPVANALYAARFLNTLYGISGSWVKATAAYHSQTPAIGADYQAARDGPVAASGPEHRRGCRRRMATSHRRSHRLRRVPADSIVCMARLPSRHRCRPGWPAAERRAAPRDRRAGAA